MNNEGKRIRKEIHDEPRSSFDNTIMNARSFRSRIFVSREQLSLDKKTAFCMLSLSSGVNILYCYGVTGNGIFSLIPGNFIHIYNKNCFLETFYNK